MTMLGCCSTMSRRRLRWYDEKLGNEFGSSLNTNLTFTVEAERVGVDGDVDCFIGGVGGDDGRRDCVCGCLV